MALRFPLCRQPVQDARLRTTTTVVVVVAAQVVPLVLVAAVDQAVPRSRP
jgi:hypothetical protein